MRSGSHPTEHANRGDGMPDRYEAMDNFRIEMSLRDKSQIVRVTVVADNEKSEFELESLVMVGIKSGSHKETDSESRCIIQGTVIGNFDNAHSRHITFGIKGILRSAKLRLVKKFLIGRRRDN